MIELPEGLALAGQIEETLTGKKIRSVIAGASPHKFAWFYGEPADYPGLFNGSVVEGAFSYGGKLHLKLDGDRGFAFFDGVVLRYYTDVKELPKKHQLSMEFEDGTYLIGTIAMYGGIYGYKGALQNSFDELARTKPSVFSEDFSPDYFKGLIVGALKPKHSAKAFLATEQRIPGLGNGVCQDILFYAGISPKRDIATLSEEEIGSLYRSVKETLADMTEKGGRNTEKDLFGAPGGYQTVMSKNTYMFPCPRCGGAVVKEAYMGGSVYYCTSCQK
jgi:formamidopyrimidine-DNA glycosylase